MKAITTAVIGGVVLVIGFGFLSPTAQGQNPPGVDPTHYQCYRVSEIKPIRAKAVKVVDQFTKSAPKVQRASLVCAPVEKNGEPPKDKDTHLTCYTVPAVNAGKKVRMIHQLGEHDLQVGGSVVLCLPSIKKLL
jgi:hypothetical protein